MTKYSGIKKSPGDGFDRIQWLDAKSAKRTIRANDPIAALDVVPGERTRRPGKYKGQRAYQGHYWCAGTQTMVFHESMAEFTGLMLIDHLHNIITVAAQPMLITFADGTFHYPDYLAVEADATRLLVDVHPKSLTTEAHERAFEATRLMCERLGWRYLLIDQLSRVVRWNLEMLARFHHPRFEPAADLRANILRLSSEHPVFGELLDALRTDKPGENVPALIHLLWQRELRIDLTMPITRQTAIWTD